MMRPSPPVNTWPAIPVWLSSRSSRWKVPWATRETSSFDIGSFRKIVPRSQLSSAVVTSMSSESTSSSVALPAILREIASRSSAKRRRLDWSEIGAFGRLRCRISWSAAMSALRLFEGFADRGDHRLQLLDLVVGVAHRLADLPVLVAALFLERLAQRRRRRLELRDFVVRRSNRFLDELVALDPRALDRVAQRRDRVAQVAHLSGGYVAGDLGAHAARLPPHLSIDNWLLQYSGPPG